MNREERRLSQKHDQRLVVKQVIVEFEDGQVMKLDAAKIMIVDRVTKANLFKAVMEEDK